MENALLRLAGTLALLALTCAVLAVVYGDIAAAVTHALTV